MRVGGCEWSERSWQAPGWGERASGCCGDCGQGVMVSCLKCAGLTFSFKPPFAALLITDSTTLYVPGFTNWEAEWTTPRASKGT